jgi:hypothetical protein
MSLPADINLGDEIPELINDRIWLLRKTSLLVSPLPFIQF